MLKTGPRFFETGSVTLEYGTFCQEYVVLQDRWSFMAVTPQDRFHCTCIRVKPGFMLFAPHNQDHHRIKMKFFSVLIFPEIILHHNSKQNQTVLMNCEVFLHVLPSFGVFHWQSLNVV